MSKGAQMKFITEEELRDIYKKEPFTNYELMPETRLTPGARQFLTDRGIDLYGVGISTDKKVVSKDQEASRQIKEVPKSTEKNHWKMKKLINRLKSIDSLFLLISEETIERDVFLAQDILKLGKQFSTIGQEIQSKGKAEQIFHKECSGIRFDNCNNELEDCFDITELHMRLEKGREILKLQHLRCAIREVEPIVREVYEGNDKDHLRCEEIIGQVNQVINCLSQMICSIVGGKECQRNR